MMTIQYAVRASCWRVEEGGPTEEVQGPRGSRGVRTRGEMNNNASKQELLRHGSNCIGSRPPRCFRAVRWTPVFLRVHYIPGFVYLAPSELTTKRMRRAEKHPHCA